MKTDEEFMMVCLEVIARNTSGWTTENHAKHLPGQQVQWPKFGLVTSRIRSTVSLPHSLQFNPFHATHELSRSETLEFVVEIDLVF
jgi:hypothetical protein